MMNEAELSAKGTFTEEYGKAGSSQLQWHGSVFLILGMLAALSIGQILFVRVPLAQEVYWLGYFIPISLSAIRLSRRGSVEVTVLSAIVYLVALTPSIQSSSVDMVGLLVEAIAQVLLFLAVGLGLSTYRFRLGREKERALLAEREKANKLELMLDVSTTVSSSLKIDQVLQVLAVRIAESTETTFCRVSLLDDSAESLKIVAAYPVREMDWEPSIGRVLALSELPDHKKAIDTKQAVVVDGRTRPDRDSLSRPQNEMLDEAASLLLFPLVVSEEAVGVVYIGEQRKWERSPLGEDKIAVCQTIVNQAAKAVAHALTHEAMEDAFLGTIRSLAEAIDAKDPSTHGHSDWVSKYSVMIARQMELDDELVESMKYAGYLHDVGKIGISDSILGKPSQLTPEQWKLMRKHPSTGAKILEPVRISPGIKAAVRHHHERFDGKGYPNQLAGEAIPLGARILAVADAYEAMTANRPYRKALTDEHAVAELKRCSGSQFDPLVLQAFLSSMGRHSSGPVEAGLETASG